MKKRIITASLLAAIIPLAMAGCGKSSAPVGAEKTDIVMGISPGPYSDLFISAVEPVLKQEGYSVKHVDFTDLLESDIAINEGSVDFNVDQHTAYLKTFNAQRGADLTPLVRIPTVAAAIFSSRHESLNDIQPHAKVAIPQDPSNASRAYRLLEKAGLIKIQQGANPVLLTRKDIAENIKQIDIIEMDSSNIPRTLQDIDYGVIPGSVAYASKVDQSKALLREDLIDDLYLVVAVKSGNEKTKWAQDIQRAYLSDDFKHYIKENNANALWNVPPEIQQ